jgi:uncharacterized membrane protein
MSKLDKKEVRKFMNDIVLGVFSDRDEADDAVAELEKSGFETKDISIITKSDEGKVVEESGNSMAEGAVSGATTGGVIGGIAGLLVGLGAIAIPGGLLIGGPIAAALGLGGAAATTVSGAVTGALAGGLVGGLVGLGVPEEDAKIYEERINAGGVLIAVPTRTRDNREAREILEDNGADKITTIHGKD